MAVALAALTAAPPAGAGSPRPRLTVRPELPATANFVSGRQAQDERGYQAHNSPLLAADPTEERFVVLASRLDAPDFGCALQLSGDGGRSWIPADPVPRLPPGAEKCYGPEVAFDGEGLLYYLFVGLHGRGNRPMGVYLTTSSDRGRSFTAPRRVLGPNSFQVRMAMDRHAGPRGRLHLVWLASGEPSLGGFPPHPNPIVAAHSDDGGKTFSRPVAVSDAHRERVVTPALALGPDRAVHVLYYDLGQDAVDYQGLEGPTWEGNWSLVLATSDDGGRRFGRGRVVDDEVVPPGRVKLIFTMAPAALAADRSVVVAAWPDARRGDPDVFVRRSGDGGQSWDRARRLNDDAVGTGAAQDLPRLSAAPGGRLDAIFYDRRDDPENVRNHVYYAFSTDGGRRFGPNHKLTTKPSDSRFGQRYELIPSAAGQVEFGSRLGLLSTDEAAVAAWTDTRNSLHPRQQDIFSTQVRLSGTTTSQGGGLNWAALAVGVAAAVAAGAGAILAGRRRGGWRRRPGPG